MRRSFFTAQALAHQEPVCGDAQTGVMVKTTPVAPFIVMQAQLRLQLLIIAFNPPSALCRGNQCLDRRLLWSRREPVVAGLGLSRRPLDQQPLLVMCLAIVCGTNPHRREPRTERCVAALAPADLPIRPCGQRCATSCTEIGACALSRIGRVRGRPPLGLAGGMGAGWCDPHQTFVLLRTPTMYSRPRSLSWSRQWVSVP